jgi:hypothetical protein
MKSIFIFRFTFLFANLFQSFYSSTQYAQGISSQTIGAQTSIANSKALTTAPIHFKIFLQVSLQHILSIGTHLQLQLMQIFKCLPQKTLKQIKTFTLKANESYTSIQRDAILFDDYYFKAVSTANIRIILEGR